jgi:RND family efflux transporter MFP subunit
MNINEANAEHKARRMVDLKPPAPSYSEIIAAPEPAPHWYRFLLPAIGTIIILVSGGRALFDRLIVPKSTVAPTKITAIPVRLTNPKVAKVQDSSIYPVNLKSQQSIGIKTQLAGQITRIFVKPSDRVKVGQILFQLAAPQQPTQVVKRTAIVAPAVKNETTQVNEIEANTRLRSLDARKVSVQADVRLKQQEYQRFEQLATAGAASQQTVTQKLDKLLAAEAILKEVEASIQAEKSRIELSRSRMIADRLAVKTTKVDPQIDTARIETQQHTIAAPFSGIVGNIPAKIGAVVTKQTQLLTIVPTDRVEVKLQIPADRASSLRIGFPVQLIDERDRLLQTGQISEIVPTVDPVKRSIQAKATFSNLQNISTAGLVRAKLTWKENSTVVLPNTAISQLAGQNFAFVAVASKNANCSIEIKDQNMPADGLMAVQRPIQLGKPIGTDRSVLSGLNATDRIITSELPRLKNCAPIVDLAQPLQAPNKTGG